MEWVTWPDDFINKVICGDCLKVMKEIPDNSIDLVVTDPPYGIDYKSSWAQGRDGRPRWTDSSFGADRLDLWCLPQIARILQPEGAIYVFVHWRMMGMWIKAFDDVGFKVAQRLIWDKSKWGFGDLRYYGSQTEDILFVPSNGHTLRTHQRDSNIWRTLSAAFLPEGKTAHPTQKPEEVMKKAIGNSSDEGHIILDPFLGSGTTAVAAKRLGRKYVGIEINPDYCKIAEERLAQEELF